MESFFFLLDIVSYCHLERTGHQNCVDLASGWLCFFAMLIST